MTLQGWTLQDWTMKDWTLTDWTLQDWTLTDEYVGSNCTGLLITEKDAGNYASKPTRHQCVHRTHRLQCLSFDASGLTCVI